MQALEKKVWGEFLFGVVDFNDSEPRLKRGLLQPLCSASPFMPTCLRHPRSYPRHAVDRTSSHELCLVPAGSE